MEPKLLLVKLITLLYKENFLSNSTNSAELAREVIQTIKLPEAGVDFDRSRDTTVSLRNTVTWMAEQRSDEKFDTPTLLQRIRVNVGEDEGLYVAIEQGFNGSEDETQLKKEIVLLRRELNGFLRQTRASEIIKKASQKVLFNGDEIDWSTFVAELTDQLEPFASAGDGGRQEGLVDEIDMEDIDGIADLFTRATNEISLAGIIRVPWQGFERMTGDHRGLRRGETIVLGALQHNFKTGFCMGLTRGAALYNSPWMMDPNKKPLIVYISLEDDLTKAILSLYKQLKELETKQFCDIRYFETLTDEVEKLKAITEASKYISETMIRTGYSFKMRRFNPSDYDYRKHYDYITGLEAEGYEIHMVCIDYLNMMSKRGCDEGPTGANIRDLWRRMRNFHSAKSIVLLSPHQLSTEAKMLVRQGHDDVVKEIANKGFYDGCRTLDQEVDLEVYIHIVKVGGRSYLTLQRGKHRKAGAETPDKDKYVVIPFQEIGALVDDIHGEDTSMSKPGADMSFEKADSFW